MANNVSKPFTYRKFKFYRKISYVRADSGRLNREKKSHLVIHPIDGEI